MKQKLQIDLVSDVVCPWCIIGYKRLEKAIAELGVADQISIEWQPFELNPNMPSEGELVGEHLTNKYGTSDEDNKRNQEMLTKLGAEVNFKFNFTDELKMVNTRDAHILLDYANEKGKQTELNIRLITAFYNEGKDVSNHEVLMQELTAVGLDLEEAMARLNDSSSTNSIQEKESYWHQMGVNSVPTMVFNRTSALTGAQPIEVYKQVLTELLAEI